VDGFITNEEISMPYTEIMFCSLDYSSNTLNYAGVNTSLFALKRDKLVELKSERSVNGFFTKDLEIVSHKIQLAKQDLLYILNDGFLGFRKSYPDSYLSDELMELLRTVSKEDIKKQGKMLQKTFEHWKTDLKQQTDMTVVGIRL
jgi:serine phosphatase RsbU (regulator of sigma subunit)